MSEDYKKFLTKNILRTTKQFAVNNLNDVKRFDETSEHFFTRIYCSSFIDALLADGYEVTISKNDKEYTFKKDET